MTLLQRFETFLRKECETEPGKPLLVAVSGGLDSVVLAHLLRQVGQPFHIAHCNFQLRAGESEMDEQFVQALAQQLGAPFHTRRVETEAFASERGISLQMAARVLRYRWFHQVLQDEDLSAIAIAHHLDDQAETLLLNLTRGTGIRGLRGMLPCQEQVVRPLLFAAKEELLEYAQEHQLPWREDATNRTVKYQRNRIRHQVMPVLKEQNPQLLPNIRQTLQQLRFAEALMKEQLEVWREKVVQEGPREMRFRLQPLQEFAFPEELLHELLRLYKVPGDLRDRVGELLEAQPGKELASGRYCLLRDREALVLTHEQQLPQPVEVLEGQQQAYYNGWLFTFQEMAWNDYPDLKEPQVAYLDREKIRFPLTLRSWQEGDNFVPFGMKGSKKLSNFFIDEQVPKHEKPQVPLLLSDGVIAWVAGMRTDQRFSISQKTQQALRVEMQPIPPGQLA